MLLLDGLNEVPAARRAEKARELAAWFRTLPANTAIYVSCRAEDYSADAGLDLDTLSIEPLSPQRIRAAVRQWVTAAVDSVEVADRFFWQLAGDERLSALLEKWLSAGATEDAFWNANHPQDHKNVYDRTTGDDDNLWLGHIRNPRSLVRLAANPFMLTMLFQVWVAGSGELPRNRGGLFRAFVECLLTREGLAREDGEQRGLKPEGEALLAGLARLAWNMQSARARTSAGDGEEDNAGVLTVALREEALHALGGAEMLRRAIAASVLEGNLEIRFRHQLLQEYFSAQALAERLPTMAATELWPAATWWQRTGWEETVKLLAGFHDDDCSPVVKWLKQAQPETAAACVLESGADVAGRDVLFAELAAAWRPRLTGPDADPEPEARAAIGRALGVLNLDQRPGIGVTPEGIPDIDWVWVDAGTFVYQEGERRLLDAFAIARFPITNAQFQAFVDAPDGYRNPVWWEGLAEPKWEPASPGWPEPNHPRETVNWYEAMAFCGWLFRKLERLVTLPTEWQWERAARGTGGKRYPWGNEYRAGAANINESYGDAGPHYLGGTSPVGIYPHGQSDEHVFDLAGNVWEWCLNEYQDSQRIQHAGGKARVLRGGSWYYVRGSARAGARYDYDPYLRSFIIGFRVVCSSPIR